MAIATVLTFRGGTLERYDVLLAKLGFAAGGPGPSGLLFSWVTATDEGLLVTGRVAVHDGRSSSSRRVFGPLAAEVGMRGPPQITFHDVHSYLTAG